MGADLFKSYVGSLISSIALAAAGIGVFGDQVVFPLMLAGAGFVAAILGTFVVRSGKQADFGQLLWALRRGIFPFGYLASSVCVRNNPLLWMGYRLVLVRLVWPCGRRSNRFSYRILHFI
ncbi:MAG: hypothetical protein CM1200mP15_07680 [Dehalococcoidia bacterium]|nr:MAG: hypothetical protein CM1200mP15_07680 [Dehalococcoidia bacterium]